MRSLRNTGSVSQPAEPILRGAAPGRRLHARGARQGLLWPTQSAQRAQDHRGGRGCHCLYNNGNAHPERCGIAKTKGDCGRGNAIGQTVPSLWAQEALPWRIPEHGPSPGR